VGRDAKTVLAVDGSVTALFSLVMLLGRLEYRVLRARNGRDALQTLRGGSAAIVITNGLLPDMDATGLLKAMQEDPQCGSVPVIVLLSKEDAALEAECRRLGCAACLPRSVEPEELYRTMQALSESVPRRHVRLTTSIRVFVGDGTTAGGPERTEQATALSEGGLFVQTRYPQPKNAVTPLRLVLGSREVRAKAVVLYSTSSGMGMKFTELSADDRDRIRQFIKEQLIDGLSH
jgi:CheY-like chemotaxis protein